MRRRQTAVPYSASLATGRAALVAVVVTLSACSASLQRVEPRAGPLPGVAAPDVFSARSRPPAEEEEEERLPHAPGRYFGSRTLHEDQLAGHHEHAVVELLDIPLFVLRDEDVFKTTADRAEAAARALREALHAEDRFFIGGEETGVPAIYSVSHHGAFPRLVLRITRGDALAYARRSQRDVDQRALAGWWLAVLKDVFGVVFLNQTPTATVAAAGGDSLMLLRERLWGTRTREPISPERVKTALASLPEPTRARLEALAFTVPPPFAVTSGGASSSGDAR